VQQGVRKQTRRPVQAVVKLVGSLVASLVAVIGGWLGYSAVFINHHLPLAPALDAERRTFNSAAGKLSYYVERQANDRPLVLIHSINAAASAYEMRPLFERYREQRPVYALDLPGFGFSERPDQTYLPGLYAQAIIDLLATQVEGEAADVVAFSLGSEFAAQAAKQRPELFNSLTLISPSGFNARNSENRVQNNGRSSTSDRVLRALLFPLWSQGLYDLLATRPSINYFLQRNFAGTVDQGWVDYSYATAHQPGARYAPFHFVSGKLFTPDIRETVYEQLTIPVLVLYDQDPNVRFDTLPDVLQRNTNWRAQRITPTLGVPHWEKLDETAQTLAQFWQETTQSRAD